MHRQLRTRSDMPLIIGTTKIGPVVVTKRLANGQNCCEKAEYNGCRTLFYHVELFVSVKEPLFVCCAYDCRMWYAGQQENS